MFKWIYLMAKDPAFPFYAADFSDGCQLLTMEERGIYITCLAFQWTHENRIPKKRLGLLVGIGWDKWPEELREKFTDLGEFIRNERLLAERKKRDAFKEKQRINGAKGGRPKNPNETQRITQTITQKNPLENENESESEKENEKGKVELWPTFEDFWETYNKKHDRKKCETKWSKLDQKTKEEIMSYLPDYIEATSGPRRKFRRHPATFLNNETWKNEIEGGIDLKRELAESFREV